MTIVWFHCQYFLGCHCAIFHLYCHVSQEKHITGYFVQCVINFGASIIQHTELRRMFVKNIEI